MTSTSSTATDARPGQRGSRRAFMQPAALTDLMKTDADEWRRLIRQIGFTAES